MNNLALGYLADSDLNQALPLLENTLELRRKKLRNDHPDTQQSMYNLATGYLAANKVDPALAHFREAAAGVEKGGFRHESADLMINNLVRFQEKLKQFDQAEPWRR